MKVSIIILIVVGISLFEIAYSQSLNELKREEALEYLLAERENDMNGFLKRSLIRNGPEQRREALEKFEEKCERSRYTKTINKISSAGHTKKQRFIFLSLAIFIRFIDLIMPFFYFFRW